LARGGVLHLRTVGPTRIPCECRRTARLRSEVAAAMMLRPVATQSQ
jgi:hypothetical protein